MRSVSAPRIGGVTLSSRWRTNALSTLGLVACSVIASCSDDKKAADDPDAGSRVAQVPETVLQIDSTASCRIDEECVADRHCFHGACVWECDDDSDCESGDTCSARRRCESEGAGGTAKTREAPSGAQDGAGGRAKAATPEAVPDVEVVNAPPEIVRVEAGTTEVRVRVKTNVPVKGGVVGYTVETYSYKKREARPPQKLFRAKGTDTFEFVVPTGTANPDDPEPGIEEVQLVTSVGSFRLKLQPKPTLSGRYGGAVTVSRFGPVGMPIDFEIVTDPIDAEPEDAEHVYLVLPVEPGNIYSPVSPLGGETEFVATELTFQDFDQTWLATTRAPFAFGEGSMLERYGADEVMRGLRFQLTFQDGAVTGTLRDSWEGLYDARTSDGVDSRATVVFEGQLNASRVGPSRELAALPTLRVRDTRAVSARPLPDIESACPEAQFVVDEVSVDGAAMDCAGIGSASDFAAASSSDQARCAIAVAENALSAGKTTASLIAAFLSGDTDVTGSESFSEFMARCAAGTEGACRPSPEVLCGRALTAYAATTQLAPDGNFASLFDAYTRSTRETFLGLQLAAHQSDADTRLEWLKAQNYPAIVTAAVRDLNEQLIEDWRSRVLDAHFAALGGQYDATGLSVLARQVQGAALSDQRQLLLTEMTQSWRGAMEALTVATRRWNDIYQDTVSRGETANFVAGQAFDLYVLSGLVDDLNVAAGSGYASFGMAAGFSSLLNELRRLSLPFSSLIFDRDAEVVVSRSLDPLKTDDKLLSDLEVSAKNELDLAATMVNSIIERAQKQAVDEQLLRDDLNNQIDEHFDELVTLCGLPEGCGFADRDKPECWPAVQMGQCGFGLEVTNEGTLSEPQLQVDVVDWAPTSGVSDASEAILDLRKAEAALRESQVALTTYHNVTQQMLQTNDARKAELERLAEQADATQQQVDVLWEEIRNLEDAQLAEVDTWFEDMKKTREQAYAERKAAVENVNRVRRDDVEADIRNIWAVTSLTQTATGLRAAADRAETITSITADGIPKAPDEAGAPLIAATKMVTHGITSGMHIAAEGLDVAAGLLQAEREARNLTAADELEKLNLQSELDMLKRENELTDIEAKLNKALEHNSVAQQRAREMIDLLWSALESDAQYARDLSVLYDRRDDIHARIVGELDRSTAVQQAQYTVTQRQVAYASIVQRAQLLDGRLRNLVAQRDLVNLNLGSPSVVFGWANQLEQAESRLARAKDKLMDWVVALEYLAVRPFMDARLQILLARNTTQLSEIADSLTEIQNRCGGAINTNVSTISLRDDILRLDSSLRDAVEGGVLSPSEAFRTILSRGAIPMDTRVRFSADSTIGDLVSRGGVWAASFNVDLSDFANLGASCNAKVQEIAIELVGQDLGGTQPTVGLAYDGTSSVRSCQPNIDSIVENIGPDATAFSAVTLFRTPGRVLAPTAGINEFGQTNQTLIGLPLASQYTVIIDPALGQNASVNWDNLEDVRIQFSYAYQDFYPAGQCH